MPCRAAPPLSALQLGSFTKIKVSTFPRDLLDPMQSRCGSLPGEARLRYQQAGSWRAPLRSMLPGRRSPARCLREGVSMPQPPAATLWSPLLLTPLPCSCPAVGSMPKSLTMPKHRIPSFSSLLSPKVCVSLGQPPAAGR